MAHLERLVTWPLQSKAKQRPNKGQTKAPASFKGNFGVYGPILFKLCVEVAYCSPGMTCCMAFAIKCQTKAAAALKPPLKISNYFDILFNY